MIGYLQGKVLSKDKQNLILLCGDVGYLIATPASCLEKAARNNKIGLHIHTRVREDEIALYGFPTLEELEFFRLLIGVNGVGPKTALEILNAEINLVKNAIAQENAAFLSKVPGIGKKTAERIIVDLKSKVLPTNFEQIAEDRADELEEVIIALDNLGYQRNEIHRVLKKIPPNVTSNEEIVTYFLKNV